VDIANPKIEIVTTPDSVKDPTEKFDFSRSESVTSNDSQLNWITTPEFLAQKHNLTFPDSNNCSPVLPTKQPHKCRRFSVDLSQMRSLRLFFNDNSCTCGQLVVASRESQYKILHFHHGGLDHLAQVLHQWHSLLHNIKHAKGKLKEFKKFLANLLILFQVTKRISLIVTSWCADPKSPTWNSTQKKAKFPNSPKKLSGVYSMKSDNSKTI
jgi:hypothetical protein